jgi:hypothetical protein
LARPSGGDFREREVACFARRDSVEKLGENTKANAGLRSLREQSRQFWMAPLVPISGHVCGYTPRCCK